MFIIPNFYEMSMSFDEAWNTITNFGRGDALEGMNAMQRVWDEHASGSDRFEEDDDFYEWYEAEVNAYNVVYVGMSQLFGEAA
jgi:hypothetical protein